jgi:hypothetical protein
MEHGDSGQHHTSEEHPGDRGPWKVHDDLQSSIIISYNFYKYHYSV